MGSAKIERCARCITNIWGPQASQEKESTCLKEKIYQTEWCVQKNIHDLYHQMTGGKKDCGGRWSRQAKCHAIYGTLDHMMEGHLQVLHMKVNGQICVLDWSLCDNSGDRLKGQNLMQRNKSGSCCNQTVIVGIKRKGTWKKRFIREECGENNLLCLLGLWFRGWLSGVYN